MVTPELFAQSLCDDFKVPHNHFVPKIVAAIKDRIQEYQDQVLPLINTALSGRDPYDRGKLDEDDLKVFERYCGISDVAVDQSPGSGIDSPEPGVDAINGSEVDVKKDEEVDGSVEDVKMLDGHVEETVVVKEEAKEIEESEAAKVDEPMKDEKPMTVDEAMAELPSLSDEELRIIIKVGPRYI